MNELDQPFCIIGSKGKFPDRYDRYLPAILPKEPIEEPAQPSEVVSLDSKYILQRLNELEEKTNRCVKRVNSLFDKKKKGAYY